MDMQSEIFHIGLNATKDTDFNDENKDNIITIDSTT